MNKLGELFTRGIWPFLKAFYGMVKEAIIYLLELNRRWNEAWLLVIGFIAWRYSGNILYWLDPTTPPLPANDLMRFLYATIGTCIAHFVVTLMIRISHPLIFKYLYGYFYNDLYNREDEDELKSNRSLNFKSTHSLLYDSRCLRLKYSLLVFSLYLGTWLILAATYN